MNEIGFYTLQALFRGTFNQQASLTLIVLAIERYLATVHPFTFEGFCSRQVSLSISTQHFNIQWCQKRNERPLILLHKLHKIKIGGCIILC